MGNTESLFPTTEGQSDKGDSEVLVISCDICLDVFYNPLTVIPCCHHFCAACILRWSDRNEHPLCPRCLGPTRNMLKNSLVREIIDIYLKTRPEMVRSESIRSEADLVELCLMEKRLQNPQHSHMTTSDKLEREQMSNRVNNLRRTYGIYGERPVHAELERVDIQVPNPDPQQQPEDVGE